MTRKLSIVTGYGRLSEEVLALADSLPLAYVRYVIKPWIPLIGDQVEAVHDFFVRKKVPALHPFRFSEIQQDLVENEVERVFFTGDFPRSRMIQAAIRTAWSTLDKIADGKCICYINKTDAELSNPARYFLALNELLRDTHIRPLLACEIFPDLNIQPGAASVRHPPEAVLRQLPEVIVNVGRELASKPKDRNRFAQAAIVDNGMVRDVEVSGTNELIRRYAKKVQRRVMPYLLKPPSVEFNPALDQPTIGPDTVRLCQAAGLKGIVVCAETTTIANKVLTIQQANDSDMFLYALPFSEIREIYEAHFERSWTRNASIT